MTPHGNHLVRSNRRLQAMVLIHFVLQTYGTADPFEFQDFKWRGKDYFHQLRFELGAGYQLQFGHYLTSPTEKSFVPTLYLYQRPSTDLGMRGTLFYVQPGTTVGPIVGIHFRCEGDTPIIWLMVLNLFPQPGEDQWWWVQYLKGSTVQCYCSHIHQPVYQAPSSSYADVASRATEVKAEGDLVLAAMASELPQPQGVWSNPQVPEAPPPQAKQEVADDTAEGNLVPCCIRRSKGERGLCC